MQVPFKTEIPDGRSVNASVTWILTSTGVATAVAIILFLAPVIRFTGEQLKLTSLCCGIAAVAFTLLGNLQQRPRLQVIQDYLAIRRESAASPALTDALRHDAFRHAMNFPRFIVLTTFFGQWCFMGISVPLVLHWRFETFSTESALLTCFAAVSGGFISQVFTFTLLKRRLAPVVALLGQEIPDPAVRESLIHPVSLRSKIVIVVCGMMITSALFSASLAQGRARRTVEAFATTQQLRILEEIALPAFATHSIEEALVLTRRSSAMLGIELALLSRDAEASRDDSGSESLLEEELAQIRTSDAASGSSLAFESIHTFSWVRVPDSDAVLIATTPLAGIQTEAANTRRYIALASLAFVLIAMGVGAAVAQEMIQASGALADSLERVASGDLTRGEVFDSEDELGALGRRVDRMAGALRETVLTVIHAANRVDRAGNDIRSATTEVTSTSAAQSEGIGRVVKSVEYVGTEAREISASAQDLEHAVDASSLAIGALGGSGERLRSSGTLLRDKLEDVSGSIEILMARSRQISTGTHELSEGSHQTARGIEELAEALTKVERRASKAADLSAQVVESAQLGRDQVHKSVESMERIRSETLRLEQVIASLGDRTSKIHIILSVINSLADETNLLALNAAIISAQAGENGRAFSVVAGGIKELADRVQQNTQQIAEVLASLQEESNNATAAIERGRESVLKGVQLSAESGAALDAIHEAARESGARSRRIVDAVREQSKAANDMSVLVEQMDAGVQAIRSTAEAQSRDAEGAVRSSAEMGEVADLLQDLTAELNQGTSQIAESMSRVHTTSEEIDSSLQRQLTACDEATGALGTLQVHVQCNQDSALRVEGAMEGLDREADGLRNEVGRFTLITLSSDDIDIDHDAT